MHTDEERLALLRQTLALPPLACDTNTPVNGVFDGSIFEKELPTAAAPGELCGSHLLPANRAKRESNNGGSNRYYFCTTSTCWSSRMLSSAT